MAPTLATKASTNNSADTLRLAMKDAALASGMKSADTFEQFLLVALPRVQDYVRALVRRKQYGRARVIADALYAIANDIPVETVDAVLHPATVSDAAEECSESAYRQHRDKFSRRRLIQDKEKEVSDGLRMIRALVAEEEQERAGGLH